MKTTNPRFSDYRDIHVDQSIIVCGCGVSLNTLPLPPKCITIGVNDVGRLFSPDYLVVLNARHQFKGDRFRYVENSDAQAIFTHLDLSLKHHKVVRFRLGQRGGVKWDSTRLPYTQNSPYVAVCLAAYLGAKRIGLIGVDFTEDHFYAKTGKHSLNRKFDEINKEYSRLYDALGKQDVRLLNLSRHSRLTAIPRQEIAEFLDGSNSGLIIPASNDLNLGQSEPTRSSEMKIAIERHSPGIVGDFLDALADTARKLNYKVYRDPRRSLSQRNMKSVVWNGRNFRANAQILYCEHAWLPRWAYQISPGGINADSHIAPFVWDGTKLDEGDQQELKTYLETLRNSGPKNYKYMQTDVSSVDGLPSEFILVPLQMEWDTNIQRHVPKRYQRMQTLVTDVSKVNPPLPVIYKQHPADVRRGNRQLRLRLSRKQDSIWIHNKGNIHQLLKGGQCKGIISLNSNVVHDGLLWNVPSITLGLNVWPRHGLGPFLRTFPDNWSALFEAWQDPERRACRDAYAYYLMKNQWTIDDVRDKQKVEKLFKGLKKFKKPAAKSRVVRISQKSLPIINVAAVNRGWFFEDLKAHFLRESGNQAVIKVSDRPRRDADAWIFLRTKEAISSPIPERSLAQIHDMFDENLYRPGGDRRCVNRCGGIVLTHPAQREILRSSDINLDQKHILERPIGALSNFSLRQKQSQPFTVAWVGRPAIHFKQDLKRVNWFVEAVRNLDSSYRAVLLGERLESHYISMKKSGIDCDYYKKSQYSIEHYPQIYSDFDCVVITSMSEAGPLSLFEALSVGVPVISTPVGWATQLIKPGINGYLVESIEEITEAIQTVREDAMGWFERRKDIRKTLNDYTLESWIKENIRIAVELAESKSKRAFIGSKRRSAATL